MPLIPAPPTEPPADTLSLHLERGLHARLKQYATFIGSTKDYVISHALRRLFRKDKDFAAWVAAEQTPSRAVPVLDAPSGDITRSAPPAAESATPALRGQPPARGR